MCGPSCNTLALCNAQMRGNDRVSPARQFALASRPMTTYPAPDVSPAWADPDSTPRLLRLADGRLVATHERIVGTALNARVVHLW